MICRHSVASRLGDTARNRTTPLLVTRAFINPYKVLHISEDADPSQIKRAYRKLALRHHPDINEEPSAEQDFLRIQEAYEILIHKREDSQANPTKNGWDFHDWYWDFTMSHRWDSHWKKHGRTGPSPFAATPSHRQQWQAQLSKLKQKAAYRRAQQQATHQTEQAGDQRHWSPRQQSEPEEHTHTNQQHSREQQEEQPPERPLEGHQQAVHAERLASQPRHHHRDWLASHGWKEDHLDHHQQLQEMHPAAVGHAPSYQYSQSQAVQQHADFSQMPTPSIKERSTGDSPNVSPQAVQPESNMSSDQSSGMLAVLLTHQLLQQLQQHGHSLEWAVKQNSMMGAAMQHVQSPHSILHKNSHPDGSADVAEDPSVDATADVVTHRVDSHLMPSHSERQANAHEQGSACTPRKSVLASDTGEVAADHQGKTAGPSGGSPSFQTQHSQVQSQLAGLRRRAARKIAA